MMFKNRNQYSGQTFKLPSLLPTLTLVAFMFLSTGASAQTRYCVRPDATGANNGSDWDNAYTSLPFSLQRGAVYYVADGIYKGYNFNTPESGTTFVYIRKATDKEHGIESGWKFEFGDGVATFTDSFIVNSGYLELDGVTGGGPVNWKNGHGFVFTSVAGTNIAYIAVSSGISNLNVRHVYFNQTGDTTAYGTGASAIKATGVLNNSLFEYCYFDNLGGSPFSWQYGSGTGSIIQYNHIGDICGVSVYDRNIHCEALVIHDTDDLHFRWNYVGDCPSSGGFVKNNVQTADSIRIYGNVFENGSAINCNTGTCTNWRVFNNTFHNLQGGAGIGGDGSVKDSYVYNNIFYKCDRASKGNYDYNWYSSSSIVRCNTPAGTHENLLYRYPNFCTEVIGGTGDPFVNSSGHSFEDFKIISSASYVIDSGYDVCLLDACSGDKKYNLDASGSIRGKDGKWDIGAIELATTPETLSPPKNLRAD